MLAVGVAGRRIAVQCHGGDQQPFVAALRAAGAEVHEVAVYAVTAAPPTASVARLTAACADGQLDAITFTSATAVEALAADDALAEALRVGAVRSACVGPVTAAAARAAALPQHRGPTHLPDGIDAAGARRGDGCRGTSFHVRGVEVRHQGSRVAVGGAVVRLTPRERRCSRPCSPPRARCCRRTGWPRTAWDEPVDGHTVEVTVNRLRRKLGPAAAAVETTNRRGYRIAV